MGDIINVISSLNILSAGYDEMPARLNSEAERHICTKEVTIF